MLIQTENTPNPNTVKFLPGLCVMESGTADFTSVDSARCSPLAEKIFIMDGVERVFFGQDFIAVTKNENTDWPVLKTKIMAAVMDHYTIGFSLFHEGMNPCDTVSGHTTSDLDDEITLQIKELLDTRVRPMVAQDGGDIVFHKYDKGIVYLTMRGACAGCPSATLTLKSGIENMLRHFVPEVLEVRQAEEF